MRTGELVDRLQEVLSKHGSVPVKVPENKCLGEWEPVYKIEELRDANGKVYEIVLLPY